MTAETQPAQPPQLAGNGAGRSLRVVGEPSASSVDVGATAGTWVMVSEDTARLLHARSLVLFEAVESRPRLVPGEHNGSVFRREGEYWSVRYDAGAFRMRDGKGLRYIAELLAHPGREIAALTLAAGGCRVGTGHTDDQLDSSGVGDAGDVLDPAARAAYGRRLADLDEQVEEGERFNDPERAARARAEIEALTGQLSAALGLNGRARRVSGPAERARQSVTKAIRTTIGRLREHDAALAEHLERAVHTGALCRYDPDPRAGVRWEF